jgi:NAD-reducing hydrogenase large subunit
MALVTPDGEVEHYDGLLRVVGPDGAMLADGLDPAAAMAQVGEAVEPWSYLKSAYWKALGHPDGLYRVGTLARVNVADRMGTPLADEALAAFRARLGRYPSSSFHYHHARLIDTLHAVEKLQALLRGDDILSPRVRSRGGINRNEGVGVAEAPRGTLMHHYRVDDDGLVQWVNLLIATGHNNLAMNASVRQVARHYVKGEALSEPMLNRVEAVIRCYDPCLSCSTHAVGQMPLLVRLLAPDGQVLDQLRR